MLDWAIVILVVGASALVMARFIRRSLTTGKRGACASCGQAEACGKLPDGFPDLAPPNCPEK